MTTTATTLTERRVRMALAVITACEDDELLADIHHRGAHAVWEELLDQDPEAAESRFVRRAHQVDLHAVEWDTIRAGSRWVVPRDEEWPVALDAMTDASPLGLWITGQRLPHDDVIVVTGARASTKYGEHVAQELAAALVEDGWTVVTGGGHGVDAAVTRMGLMATRGAVVVTAAGVDNPYPQANRDMFWSLKKRGTLISEYPPKSHPRRPQFLRRNRIMAAMAEGVVIVEAAMRSGVHTTARQAQDLGRPVMALPGPVTASTSIGTHGWIQRGEAHLVTGHRDVLEILRKETT